jgi:hypothetical protein
MPSHRATSAAPLNLRSGQNTEFSEFLNPKSMLTPGVAGGLTLLMTNSVAFAFGIPLDYLGYTALGISALFAALVASGSIPLHQRIVYQVLNTLIIFCVAMGSNVTGYNIQSRRLDLASFGLGSPAYAQPAPSDAKQGDVVQNVEGITANPSLSNQQKLEAIQKQLRNMPPPDDRGSNQGFFRPWGF